MKLSSKTYTCDSCGRILEYEPTLSSQVYFCLQCGSLDLSEDEDDLNDDIDIDIPEEGGEG